MEHISEDAESLPEAASLQSRMAVLSDFPETDEDCYEAFKEPGVTIFDAQDLRSTALRSLITEIMLGNLWGFKLTHRDSCPMIIVLDECQHLRFDENSMAQTILREGRKYDICGWFSSQWIDKKNAVRSLSQAALQIAFRPDNLEIERTAKRLTLAVTHKFGRCKSKLLAMEPGQFFFLKSGTPIFVDGNVDNSTSDFDNTEKEI